MKFRRKWRQSWVLSLFGGRHTYPVTIEFNFRHFGLKGFHGPFYPDRAALIEEHGGGSFRPYEQWGWQPGGPLIWGTSGILNCGVGHDHKTHHRLWIYSIWGTICHIDFIVDKKKAPPHDR